MTFFLLLSVGVHMLALATWQSVDRAEFSIHANKQPLQLTLSSRPQSTPASSSTASTVTKQETQRPQLQAAPARPITAKARQIAVSTATMTPSSPEHKPAHATPPAKLVTPTETVQLQTTASPEQQLPSLNQRIQKQLLVKFAMYRHYPPMAVRNAWQGRVNLGLRVEADGLLSNIRVINSSGYHILDQAAISSLGHVAALPEAGSWLQGQHIDVILPVIYKLTDS